MAEVSLRHDPQSSHSYAEISRGAEIAQASTYHLGAKVVSNTAFQQETSSLLLKTSYHRMYHFRGYFMLKIGARTSIRTIFIDCQSISPDSSFYVLRIAATSALLRRVTIRLAPQCRSSCNWQSYRVQKHKFIERINEALGTSA